MKSNTPHKIEMNWTSFMETTVPGNHEHHIAWWNSLQGHRVTEPLRLKMSTLETIDHYLEVYPCLHGWLSLQYTGTDNAGFGVLLGWFLSLEYIDNCGSDNYSYETEVLVISTTLQIIRQQFELDEKRCTDLINLSDKISTQSSREFPPPPEGISTTGSKHTQHAHDICHLCYPIMDFRPQSCDGKWTSKLTKSGEFLFRHYC